MFRAASALVLALAACVSPASAQNLEYAVKATYLYKFAPFIEWPAAAFETPASPFVICVAGTDPFGSVLDQAAQNQKISTHPVVIRRLADGASAGCHVLYIASSPTQGIAQLLDAARNTPVLTVTDTASKDPARGIVHFVLDNNHVRFDIDDAAAKANGLVISSKLLTLAHAVRPRN